MLCHQDENVGCFDASSYFKQVEVCPLEDNIPEVVKLEKKIQKIVILMLLELLQV